MLEINDKLWTSRQVLFFKIILIAVQTATLIIVISILGYAEYGKYLILTIILAFIINGFSDAIKNCIVAFEVKSTEKIRLSGNDLIRKFIILTFISFSLSLIYNFELPTIYWMIISIWAIPIIGIGVIATLLKLESHVEQSLFLEIIQPILNLIIILLIYISFREIKAENLIISMTFSYLISFIVIFYRFRNLICISIGSQLMFSLENLISNFVCYVFVTEVIFLYYVSRYLPYETLVFNKLMRFRKIA